MLAEVPAFRALSCAPFELYIYWLMRMVERELQRTRELAERPLESRPNRSELRTAERRLRRQKARGRA